VELRKPPTIITATIITGIMVAIRSLVTGTIIALTGRGEVMTRSQLVKRWARSTSPPRAFGAGSLYLNSLLTIRPSGACAALKEID
jgi:hypothetical protein